MLDRILNHIESIDDPQDLKTYLQQHCKDRLPSDFDSGFHEQFRVGYKLMSVIEKLWVAAADRNAFLSGTILACVCANGFIRSPYIVLSDQFLFSSMASSLMKDYEYEKVGMLIENVANMFFEDRNYRLSYYQLLKHVSELINQNEDDFGINDQSPVIVPGDVASLILDQCHQSHKDVCVALKLAPDMLKSEIVHKLICIHRQSNFVKGFPDLWEFLYPCAEWNISVGDFLDAIVSHQNTDIMKLNDDLKNVCDVLTTNNDASGDLKFMKHVFKYCIPKIEERHVKYVQKIKHNEDPLSTFAIQAEKMILSAVTPHSAICATKSKM